jgi:hypothetical protein
MSSIETLFGERTQCDCRLCTYSRKVRAIKNRRDPQEMATIIDELMDANYSMGADLEYDEAVLNGSWPSAVDILEGALERAKVHPNRRIEDA